MKGLQRCSPSLHRPLRLFMLLLGLLQALQDGTSEAQLGLDKSETNVTPTLESLSHKAMVSKLQLNLRARTPTCFKKYRRRCESLRWH